MNSHNPIKEEGPTLRKFTAAMLHQTLFGLLYPAVLGTMLYSLLEAGFELPNAGDFGLSLTSFGLGLLVALFFILDYLYVSLFTSIETISSTLSYDWRAFFIDVGVVVSLFVSFVGVGVTQGTTLRPWLVALALAVAYAFFYWWSRIYQVVLLKAWRLKALEVTGLVFFFVISWFNSTLLVGFGLLGGCLGILIIGGAEVKAQWKAEQLTPD